MALFRTSSRIPQAALRAVLTSPSTAYAARPVVRAAPTVFCIRVQHNALAVRSFSSMGWKHSSSEGGEHGGKSDGQYNWGSHRVAILWAATGLSSTVLCEGEDDGKKENNALMDSFIDSLAPLASQMSIGSIMGYATGKALLTAGQIAAVMVGCAFMMFQGLAYKGWIEVNWQKTGTDFKSLLDMDGDGDFDGDDAKLLAKKFVEVCTFNLPGGAGFTAGLLFGMGFGGKTAGTAAAVMGGASVVPRALLAGMGATGGGGIMVTLGEEYQLMKKRTSELSDAAGGVLSSLSGPPKSEEEVFKETVSLLGLAALREMESSMRAEAKAGDAEKKAKIAKLLDVVEAQKKAVKAAK